MSETRIAWTYATPDSAVGVVGTLTVFTLEDLSTANGPLFVLRTKLPTGGLILWKHADPDRLKRQAEKVLAGFVAKLGAAFPPASKED